MKEYSIQFPLRGIWSVENSPADQIPSHGTELFGMRFALDIVKLDYDGPVKKFYKESFFKYLVAGVAKEQCYAYGHNVHASFAGTVIKKCDSIPERARVRLWSDLKNYAGVASRIQANSERISDMCGNFFIIKMDGAEVYALYAHLMPGSREVQIGHRVAEGQVIGRVGHSGNSLSPHLHMQLMDSAEHRSAKGIPFRFMNLEIRQKGGWLSRLDYLPGRSEVFRFPEA